MSQETRNTQAICWYIGDTDSSILLWCSEEIEGFHVYQGMF